RSPVESPSAVAGGTKLPTLRTVKSSPGSVETRRFGTTRLSAQVMNSVSGDWPPASSRKCSAYCGNWCSRNSTIPNISLRIARFSSQRQSPSTLPRPSPTVGLRARGLGVRRGPKMEPSSALATTHTAIRRKHRPRLGYGLPEVGAGQGRGGADADALNQRHGLNYGHVERP